VSVKAVEMVRKIRDQLYEEMKDLSLQEQKEMVERESRSLQKWLGEKHLPKKPRGAAKTK
jgi:CRISPR/Cas system type I-B associated protein Csh2 (Cas7 group RAMP superfamily)